MSFDIETITDGVRVLGFRCRRSVIFGCVSEIPNDWIVGKLDGDCIRFLPRTYETRKEARQALEI